MPAYLLYRKNEQARNEKGLHSVVVQAANLTAAVALAEAAAPWPGPYTDMIVNPALSGKKDIAAWGAIDLATLTANQVVWFEGDCVSLTGVSRGGNRFP